MLKKFCYYTDTIISRYVGCSYRPRPAIYVFLNKRVQQCSKPLKECDLQSSHALIDKRMTCDSFLVLETGIIKKNIWKTDGINENSASLTADGLDAYTLSS